MKEIEKGERRPRCAKGDMCKSAWLDEELKAPGKNTGGLVRKLVKGESLRIF